MRAFNLKNCKGCSYRCQQGGIPGSFALLLWTWREQLLPSSHSVDLKPPRQPSLSEANFGFNALRKETSQEDNIEYIIKLRSSSLFRSLTLWHRIWRSMRYIEHSHLGFATYSLHLCLGGERLGHILQAVIQNLSNNCCNGFSLLCSQSLSF
jgi:hypothetical protein